VRRILFRASVALLCVAVFGCGSTMPSEHLVTGSWGGRDIAVTATPDSLVASFACYVSVFRGPIGLAADQTFAGTGTVALSTDGALIGNPARMSGAIRGDTLFFGYGDRDVQGNTHPDSPWTFYIDTLVAGQHPTTTVEFCPV
jgi:hypothetical protein